MFGHAPNQYRTVNQPGQMTGLEDTCVLEGSLA